ncbi:hypothetical protein [Caulobacter sp. LjRoot300]|uniref:hypothetical protein n=1 Tax=Caulobacter sp. LjRoot300 TaxID=3342321 RepID=UPI003ED0047D
MHIQLNHNASPPVPSERSQRARSLVFFGLGVLAATCLNGYGKGAPVELIVPENGFISLNVPLKVWDCDLGSVAPQIDKNLRSLLDAQAVRV